VYGIWGSGASDVYVVTSERLLHGSGSSWQSPLDFTPSLATCVWADTRSRVVVGGAGVVFRLRDGVWIEELVTPSHDEIEVIAGTGWDDLYAATYGAVYRYDGMTWAVSADTIDGVSDMVALPENELVAVSKLDRVYHRDASGWRSIREPVGPIPIVHRTIWASSVGDVYVVDHEGVLHFDGSSWARVLRSSYCRDIWGSSAHDVHVASTAGILHSDGGPFEYVGPTPPGGFHLITGTSSSRVLALGERGHAYWNDGRWSAGSRSPGVDAWGLVAGRDGSFVLLETTNRYRLSYYRD
jgi:hypothetical protein